MGSPSNYRRKKNVEVDRFSSLPDDLIAKILSYNGLKQAVKTSVLSSRWKSIWTSLPYLDLSSEDFSNKAKPLNKFLTHVFSCNDQVEFSLNLCGKVSKVFIRKVLNVAFSRNIQKLSFLILSADHQVPYLSLFRSKSLKHLSLTGPGRNRFLHRITPRSMWDLPALTTLHLRRFILYDGSRNACVGLFSNCANLETLSLDNCSVMGSDSVTVSHRHISNLTLKNMRTRVEVVKVVTPQLKNLTIENCQGKHIISASNLTSLKCQTKYLAYYLDIDGSLPSLEKADFCVRFPGRNLAEGSKFVNLLQKFYNVRFLTLNLEIIEMMSSRVELLANQPSPFLNLESLRIYPELLDDSLEGEVTMPTKVKNYFLDSSPSATVTMVSRKELRATKYAQDLMENLRVMLQQQKALTKRQKEKLRQPRTRKRPRDMSKRVAQIDNYWVHLNKYISIGKTKTIHIISLIRQINELLISLPTSKKAEMQPYFSSLCAEADSVMKKISSLRKVRFSKKESCLRVCLHELATAAGSSY